MSKDITCTRCKDVVDIDHIVGGGFMGYLNEIAVCLCPICTTIVGLKDYFKNHEDNGTCYDFRH